MRNHDARLKKLEARKKGFQIILAPRECVQGSPEMLAFCQWIQETAPGTIVLSHEDLRY